MMLRILPANLFALILIASTGCSSLGLSLWPAQFPLLDKTKDFAAKSPLPSGLPHELAKHVLPNYFVEPGDRILIEPVAFDSELRTIGDQKIQVDGSVDLGEFGRLRVAGMTVETIELAVEDRIEQLSGKREVINVQLIETNASLVYVLGEVGSPGIVSLDGNETVLDAILAAGGLTGRASPCDIILVRPTDPCNCRVVLPVCYRQITQLGDTSTNYQMQPGDRVVVGARTFCEEIAVWKQTQGCERCDLSRCVECKPSTVNYTNRFFHWANPFALPSKLKQTTEGVEADALETAPSEVPRINRTPSYEESNDSDIFLSPEVPQDTEASYRANQAWPVAGAPVIRWHADR